MQQSRDTPPEGYTAIPRVPRLPPDTAPVKAPDTTPDTAPDIPPSGWNGRGRRRKSPPSPRAALVLLVLWLLITGSGFLPASFFQALNIAPLREPPFPMIGAALMVLGAVALLGWSDVRLGAAHPGTARLFWLPNLYLGIMAAAVLALGPPPAPHIVMLVFAMGWLALSEELMFRGVLFPALRTRLRIWPAILLTSFLFGVIHVPNAFGQSTLFDVAVQSVAAMMTGLVLLAIRLRRGSIWPAVWYHMAWNVGVFSLGMAGREVSPDTSPLLAQPPAEANLVGSLIILALIVPNAAYALYLLRHAHRGGMPGDLPAAPPNPHAPPKHDEGDRL